MARLSANDYRAGLKVVQQLAAARSAAEFARRGIELIDKLVPSELTTLSVCDLATGRRSVVARPAGAIGAAERAAFDRHFDEHPLVRHHTIERGRDAHRISDSVPFSRFRHCALYADYYRRVGIDHVIAVPLHVDERLLVSFVLNRSRRDFSDRERERLDAIAGSLGEIYRRAVALDRACAAVRALDHQLAAGATGCIHLGAHGDVRDFSPRAAEVAQRLWGMPLRRGARLPEELNNWLARPLRCALVTTTMPPLVRSTWAGQLTVRTYPSFEPAGGWLLVLEDSSAVTDPPPADRWPLTPREREVMRWLAAGKTDRDIGAILGISPRTVHKHLQRIYTKLGVETRTAAVSRWLGPR
jgi:DNA-binding CsgD family transcriptional regulator